MAKWDILVDHRLSFRMNLMVLWQFLEPRDVFQGPTTVEFSDPCKAFDSSDITKLWYYFFRE